MTGENLLRELLDAVTRGEAVVLATVASTRGSVPRGPGAKALFYADGRQSGTLGGGRFESLAAADALATLRGRGCLLRVYPLHEESPESFGAICGGEVTVFFEPQVPKDSLVILGAGHCGQALSRLARGCGWHVTVIDDRAEWLAGCDAAVRFGGTLEEFLAGREWRAGEALVLASRNHALDREALAGALARPGAAYIGMIGSRRKVARVFAELRVRGVSDEALARVHAPVGLDVGADSPAEIAVSVLAEAMQVLRGRPGGFLRRNPEAGSGESFHGTIT